MARIKHTKNELKAQRDALRRFERFLPMLQLKKQQLQMEMHAIDVRLAAKHAELDALRASLDRWIDLFSEPVEPADLIRVRGIRIETGNVAGLAIPLLADVLFELPAVNLETTPAWVDDAVEALEPLLRLSFEAALLEKQRVLVAAELRVTSQRVNLFEKVRIPRCRENIRVIRIFLGDEQTAGVARAKHAKRLALNRAAPAGDQP